MPYFGGDGKEEEASYYYHFMRKPLRDSPAFPKHFLKCEKKIGQMYEYKL